MEEITKEQVKQAIQNFLHKEIETKLVIELAKVKKPTEEIVKEKRQKLEQEYSYKVFIDDFISSTIFFKTQELSLATHISKGINPLVKSDNVFFNSNNVIGHQLVINPYIDANSNNTGAHARHLKNIANLLNVEINNFRLYRYFLNDYKILNEFFLNVSNTADNLVLFINSRLTQALNNPYSDERNKQLLFPLGVNSYICLLPLHPSSLSFDLHSRVMYSRFSKSSRASRAARQNNEISIPYKEVVNLAYLTIGGTKPQNVSHLIGDKQNGRNYLLPSLPPQFKQRYKFRLQPYVESIFSKSLEYRCKSIFRALIRLIKTKYNNVNIRNARKNILDNLLYEVLVVANHIQEEYPAGWSKDYSLEINEKLWLDPQRAKLDEQFAEQRQTLEWQQEISNRFANWVNNQLKQYLRDIKHEFADAEYMEWQQEMLDMIKETRRQGMEIFQ